MHIKKSTTHQQIHGQLLHTLSFSANHDAGVSFKSEGLHRTNFGEICASKPFVDGCRCSAAESRTKTSYIKEDI